MATPRKRYCIITSDLARELDLRTLGTVTKLVALLVARWAEDVKPIENAGIATLSASDLQHLTGLARPSRAAQKLSDSLEEAAIEATLRPLTRRARGSGNPSRWFFSWPKFAEFQRLGSRKEGIPHPHPQPQPERESARVPQGATGTVGPAFYPAPTKVSEEILKALRRRFPDITGKQLHLRAEACFAHYRGKGESRANWTAVAVEWITKDLLSSRSSPASERAVR
jgi:hypothetical protein